MIGLNNISPPGLAHDEVANWLIDRSILAGNHAVYFTRAYGHEAGFHYVQTGFVALFGDNAFALRLPAVLAGVLGIAVCYQLVRKLLGQESALIAAALLAVLFWPVFYSRLALRAIFLPVTAGLSAYFWWVAWEGTNRSAVHSFTPSPRHSATISLPYSLKNFALSGLFTALSVNIYPAARALPLFYAAWLLYLTVTGWRGVWRRIGGIGVFTAVFVTLSAPLFLFLQRNPGAEFRVAEVSYPLTQLRQGNALPLIENGYAIAKMFAFSGDPLWRQNVAFVPVFEPFVGTLFYIGLLFVIFRWKSPKFLFILLWSIVAMTPSLVTINAPSTIRMVLLLPLLTAFPALVIHIFPKLSTVFPDLSTVLHKGRGILLLTILLINVWRTAWLTFGVWPGGGEIPFVWQAAFSEIAGLVEDNVPTAVGGWSPDTMDSQTMALLFNGTPPALSYFGPLDGTVMLPDSETAVHLFIPTALDPPPALLALNPQIDRYNHTTRYAVAPSPHHSITPSPFATFNDQLALTALTSTDGRLQSTWRTLTPQQQPLRLFVQAIDAAGNVIAEDYRWDSLDPQGLWFPHWQADVTILQSHALSLNDEIIDLRIGLFDPYSCDPLPCENVLTAQGEPFVVLPVSAVSSQQ